MRIGLSLIPVPTSGQMRSGAHFSEPDLGLELTRDDPALTIEEGGVRFELEFPTRHHLAAFVERVGQLEVPDANEDDAPHEDGASGEVSLSGEER